MEKNYQKRFTAALIILTLLNIVHYTVYAKGGAERELDT